MHQDLQALKQRMPLLDYLMRHNWTARPVGVRQEFVGLCPLHPETHPSFYVNAAKNVFYCHGCGCGGDLIRFVQLSLNLSFRAALVYLKQQLGLQIVYPGNSPVLDVMDLRQCIAGFIAADGQSFGNWTSKEGLREEPLDLHRPIRTILVSHNGLDLAKIGRAHPDTRRFHVIGYDVFQVPVFRVEFARPGAR